jgi:hypothetical protein
MVLSKQATGTLVVAMIVLVAGCSGLSNNAPASSTSSGTAVETISDTQPSVPTQERTTENIPTSGKNNSESPTTPLTDDVTETPDQPQTEESPETTSSEPESEPDLGYINGTVYEWVDSEYNDTRLLVRINSIKSQKEIETKDGTENAPNNHEFVIVTLRLRSLPGNPIRVGHEQWTMVNSFDQQLNPNDTIMDDLDDGMPEQTFLPRNTHREYRLVFTTNKTVDLYFIMRSYEDQGGPDIVFTG